MKTNFEKAVEIISNSYMNDGVELDSIEPKTIGDLFKVYQYSSSELKDEFDYILQSKGFDSYSDKLEIFDEDNTIHSFKELLREVKKVKVI